MRQRVTFLLQRLTNWWAIVLAGPRLGVAYILRGPIWSAKVVGEQ
jgi:hypothetical protein